MPFSAAYRPATRHMTLGDAFYDPVKAADFPAHILRFRNQDAAGRGGLDTLTDAEWIAHLGRFEPLPDSLPQPLALRYHGHQFQSYNPDLGDGRGFLFAQLYDALDGRLLDIGTKGSGTTPWSRGGDGRLTLKGGVREILASETLDAIGVTTSRSLSVIETGEVLHRGDEPSPTRSCVLARQGHSHIRIGTFQRLAAMEDLPSLRLLLEYVIATYYPALSGGEDPAADLLDALCARLALLTAQWMTAGFVHGVLNTDNINIAGESFDYGPWRFAPHYDPSFTAAYFDHSGLYSFGRQPTAMMWNLARMAECLLPFSEMEKIRSIFEKFPKRYERFLDICTLQRLGLHEESRNKSTELRESVWSFLEESRIGFEFLFFDWYGGAISCERAMSGPRKYFYESSAFQALRNRIEAHAPRAGVDVSLAYFRRDDPCAMWIERVEGIWHPVARDDDWSAFHAAMAHVAEMKSALGAAGHIRCATDGTLTGTGN
ncbi:protein adenylyltransferase SelO family protein [Novacetimonas pomaceti]|uniref:protein adenylyltransferase SelO family protein n=1 Tax=Novacetimonas pomaceti TaxID=2021998 RepID=UPI001C2D5BF2|nr:YdiU family protein [Novacetimonas pomaceti]MBV1835313.1 YdiU family protein [Novacetimonas pomaceti]